MKLFKRIKAEQYVEPTDKVTVGSLSFGPPPSPPTVMPPHEQVVVMKDAMSVPHKIPYTDLLDDLTVHENGLLESLAKDAAKALAKKVDQDITNGNMSGTLTGGLLNSDYAAQSIKKLLSKPSAVSALMEFPEPAKGGAITGVYSMAIESIEKHAYHDKHMVRLCVLSGPDKGKHFLLQEGDTFTVNVSLSL